MRDIKSKKKEQIGRKKIQKEMEKSIYRYLSYTILNLNRKREEKIISSPKTS